MKMKFLFAVLLFFFIPSLATGEMYKWVDDNGRTHFTDDLRRVPQGQASSAKQKVRNEGFSPPQNAQEQVQYMEDASKTHRKELDSIYEPAIEAQKEYIRISKDPFSTPEKIRRAKLKARNASIGLEEAQRKSLKKYKSKLSKITPDN